MAQLLEKQKKAVVTLHKSDIVKGKITKLTPAEILVDINAKTEAVVLEKDKKILRSLLGTLKVGDEVAVSVLNTESDTGNPVVSLRRFIDDILWKRLEEKQKTQEPVHVAITEATKGGYLVDTDFGLSGFLPNSQTAVTTSLAEEGARQYSQELIGKKMDVYILEQNRQAHKIIFSQKPMVSEKQFKETVQNVKNGQKFTSIISHIATFGIFVTVPIEEGKTVDGLIHISEISWDKTEDIAALFTVGQTVETMVIGTDRDGKRLDLSIKRLTADPFEAVFKKYTADQKVTGVVSKVSDSGVTIDIVDEMAPNETIEGIIRKDKIPPSVKFEVGSTVIATVSEVDTKRHRIMLLPVLKEKPIGYR